MTTSRKRIVIEYPVESEDKVLSRVADIIMGTPGTTWADRTKELEINDGQLVVRVTEYYPPNPVSGQTDK
jgi:hypothetical protein